MLLKYFYHKPLAHASYLVGCQKTGDAIVIDPDRKIQPYLDAAKREGMRITGSVETHIHADYVSGSRELAEATGAKIFVSDEGPEDWKYTFVQQYSHQLLKGGETFMIGNIKFQVMHTPGHTPESISLVLTDMGGGADEPMGVFTGDFVFVGSLGRPDLLEEAAGQQGTAEPGARDLFKSVQKFKQLPDYLQIWPSHGAGSACGKGLGAIPSSTVGYEKRFNEGLQFECEDEFVKYILSDQPEAPDYFAVMKHVNKHGPNVVGDSGLPEKLPVEKLRETIANAMVIDLRTPSEFSKRHVPGTINVDSRFIARDAGWFVDYQQPIFVVAPEACLAASIDLLREIGIDNVPGYFESSEVIDSGEATESYPNQTPDEVANLIQNGEAVLVDVRRQAEWDEGHIPQATYSFLGELDSQVKQLPNDKPIVFQCRTGGRSAVACGIAQAAGYKNVINMSGGIIDWEMRGYPVVIDQPATIG